MKKLLFLILSLFFASCKNTSEGGNPTPSVKTHKVSFCVQDATTGSIVAKIKDGVNLTTSPSMVENGKMLVFTANPASSDYKVDKWLINNKEDLNEKDKTSIEIKVEKDLEVKVIFKKTTLDPPISETVKVKFSIEGGGGALTARIKGATEDLATSTDGASVEKGKTVVFTAKPNNNYEVEKWIKDNIDVAGNTTNTYELIVNDNVKVKVKFKEKTTPPPTPQIHKVTFEAGEGGTLKAKIKDGNELIASPSNVENGKTIVFTATANSSYKVEKWFKDGIEETGKTDNTYELMITANVTVKVKFIAIPQTNGSYDVSTGVGKVGDAEFTMIKIDEVSEKWLGVPRERHKVSLSTYWIGETEVTQKLYNEVMKENPSFFDNKGSKVYNGVSYSTAPDADEIQENRPVEQITWFDCIAFCNELTKQIGLGEDECVYYSDEAWTKFYTKEDAKNKSQVFIYKTPKDSKNMSAEMNKKGFRLPTEAEWEWAAMGGKEEVWSGTNEETKVVEYAWLDSNSNKKTHEVKKKSPNAYGLYDMTGNVMECCWDWHGIIAKDSDSGKNPIGAISGTEKTVRGGNFVITMPFLAENKTRGRLDTKLPQRYLGMRLVKGN